MLSGTVRNVLYICENVENVNKNSVKKKKKEKGTAPAMERRIRPQLLQFVCLFFFAYLTPKLESVRLY